MRLADFHSARGQALQILRPLAGGERLYLRRLPDEREFALASGDPVLALAARGTGAASPRARGR